MKTVKATPYNEVEVPPTQTVDILLEIEGLVANHDDTFTLRDVAIAQPDYEAITKTLIAAGIEKDDAHYLADTFAEKVYHFQLAKLFAQRTKRVG